MPNGTDASKLTFEQIVTHPTMSLQDKNMLIMMYHKDRMSEWEQYGLGGVPLRDVPKEEAWMPPISPITGKPSIPTRRAGEPPAGALATGTAGATWQEMVSAAEATAEAEGGVAEIKPAVRWDVTIDEDTGYRVMVGYDEEGNVVSYEPIGAPPAPTEMTEAERAEMEFARERETARTEEERRAFEAQQQQWTWQQQQTQQEFQLQQQQAQQQAQWQQWQQAESQRQYGAQLAAQPQSWLQYAGYTGEIPAVQPWMLPLMPQEYAGMVAGEPIPGWVTQPQEEGQAFSMAGMPQITRPSRQYQARMGPTAMEQYYGYRQARTGVTPEEEQWRLWSGAPPGGYHRGLQFTR